MLTFTKAAPEETGVPSEGIIRMINRLQKRRIPMHSLLLMRHDKLIFEGYYAPCRADSLHRMFSISKSITSIAIGLLVDEGRVSLDDPIVRYFPEKVPKNVHPWIAQMTIRDMLMMRSCHAVTTYKKNMAADWVESYFTTPPTHPPATLFHYDTSAPHTLCALVEKLTGGSMLDYIKKKLDVLGLSPESYMIADPFGVSMGGSGLVAYSMDMLKFGYFIAHRGNVLGKQLISPSYIDMAVSMLTETRVTAPLPSEAQGYGLQIWRNEQNGFVCYGMGGQLIICLPDYDLICVTTADTQTVQGGNQQIYDALYEEILPYLQDAAIACDKSGEKALADVCASLAMEPLQGADTPENIGEIADWTFKVLTPDSDFESFCVHFDLAENKTEQSVGALSFVHKGTPYAVRFGMGFMETGEFPIYEQRYAASGAWLFDGTLHIKAHIIDAYVGCVQFQLAFRGDELTIFMSKKEESLFKEFQGHLYCKK